MEIGDKVVINGNTYYFYHEAQNAYDEIGVLKALTENGNFESISSIFSSESNDMGLFRWGKTGTYWFSSGWEYEWQEVIIPVNWGRIGQKFADADWKALGNAIIGTGELVIGAPMAITGGVLTGVVAIPGAAVSEAPVAVTGGITYIGLQLCVDGINRAAGRQLLDIGWLQWPF